jgi:mannose-6-phosphate isomerase-like protein (cupin superfamily)
MEPGSSIRLHKHPYEEIFILQKGAATFTVASASLEARAGQIIIVPANISHKFTNSGDQQLRQMDVHVNNQIITHWLED